MEAREARVADVRLATRVPAVCDGGAAVFGRYRDESVCPLVGALGDHAHKVQISSSKSMTGHMMGATGAVEAIFSVQVIRNGIIPPTIHYETPDPDCDLDYVPNEARESPVEVAISNAFGFGGHNAVLAFRSFRG